MATDWAISLPGVQPLQILGQGGFGQVWLARQEDLDRLVAVKVGHRPLDSEDDRRRFERECKALGRLSGQPNIVEVYTSGISNGLPYLVLEYIDGGTLSQVGPSLREPGLRQITDQLCQAVSAAHSIGVLHRDLKPENVFIDRNGNAILGDFGIARLGDGNNTATGQITASIGFAAPEVLQGAASSPAADVYGIGITMVSAIVGRSPFITDASDTLDAIIALVLRAEPPPLAPREISPAFEQLLFRAMAKNPADRPASVADLLADLRRLPPVTDGEPGDYLPPTPAASTRAAPATTAPSSAEALSPASPPASKRLAQVAIGGLVVVGLSVGAWAFVQPPQAVESAGVAAGAEEPPPTELIGETDDTEVLDAPAEQTPLGLPLSGTEISQLLEIPVDFEGIDELLGPANSPQYCLQKPDITGLTDTVAGIYPASPFDALRQVAQRMHRFGTPEEASAFMTSYSTFDCESWEEILTTDGELSTLRAEVVPATVSGGDEIVQIDQATVLPTGVEIFSRTVLVRSETDVYKLFFTSINEDEIDEATNALVELAVTNLDY